MRQASPPRPGTDAPPRVVHFSSAHPTFDNRIFKKECKALAAAGYDVTLVVPGEADAVVGGVKLKAIPRGRGRAERFVLTAFRAFRAALAERADLYHFHDPDLVPWGLVLKAITGRPVIYDVHEPYTASIMARPYIPKPLRPVVAGAYGGLEALARRAFAFVIAERYYARWLPQAVPVLNYPQLEEFEALRRIERVPPAGGRIRLLYTGNLYVDRGALTYADLLARLPEAEVHLIGYTPAEVAEQVKARAGGSGRLRVEGIAEHLPHERLIRAYEEPWTAGLGLLFDIPKYRDKEPTKFFEYMAAGLPVIATRTPVWQELIEGTGTGICVDPSDLDEVVAAVRRLRDDPARARAMGEAGRRVVAERFGWAGQAENLLALYRRLLPGWTPQPRGLGQPAPAAS